MAKQLVFLFWFVSFGAFASDHVDGEITIDNPVADISDVYAFMSPEKEGHLVLVLNSYPFVGRSGHFSDRLQYSLVVKPVNIVKEGGEAKFDLADEEYRFDCLFNTPHDNKPHTMACSTTREGHAELAETKRVTTVVGDEQGSNASGIKAFAGKRRDPFIFDLDWVSSIIFENCIPPANASNNIQNVNVLSIVLEVDVNSVFGEGSGPLFAVSGQISERDGELKVIDRAARPELSNLYLATEKGQQDLRPLYNAENAFALNAQNKALYIERLQKNIRYYDALDGVMDWPTEWVPVLADILVNDYLVIDTSKSFSTGGYFDIERSMFNSKAHTRSGGRVPGERVINQLVSYLINGGHGPAIVDGIAAESLPSKVFPYLGKPSGGVISFFKSIFAPSFTSRVALKERVTKDQCQ